MNWKEKFDEMKKGFLAVKHNEWWASDEDFIKDFISTEIIKKIIEDIPDIYALDEKYPTTSDRLKQQLRRTWLGKEQE